MFFEKRTLQSFGCSVGPRVSAREGSMRAIEVSSERVSGGFSATCGNMRHSLALRSDGSILRVVRHEFRRPPTGSGVRVRVRASGSPHSGVLSVQEICVPSFVAMSALAPAELGALAYEALRLAVIPWQRERRLAKGA